MAWPVLYPKGATPDEIKRLVASKLYASMDSKPEVNRGIGAQRKFRKRKGQNNG